MQPENPSSKKIIIGEKKYDTDTRIRNAVDIMARIAIRIIEQKKLAAQPENQEPHIG